MITALCPGPTSTGFASGADVGDKKIFNGPGVMTARAVAEKGYAALMNGKAIVVPGTKNRLFAGSVRFAPRALVRRIVRRIQTS